MIAKVERECGIKQIWSEHQLEASKAQVGTCGCVEESASSATLTQNSIIIHETKKSNQKMKKRGRRDDRVHVCKEYPLI